MEQSKKVNYTSSSRLCREKRPNRTEFRIYKELLTADNLKEKWTRNLKEDVMHVCVTLLFIC